MYINFSNSQMNNYMDENGNTNVNQDVNYCEKLLINDSIIGIERMQLSQNSIQKNDRAISLCLTWVLASPIFFQLALWISVSPIIHMFSKEILCFMILALSQLLTYLTYLVICVYKDCDYLQNYNPDFVSSTKENLKFKLITLSSVLMSSVGLLYFGQKAWANSLLIGVLLLNVLIKNNDKYESKFHSKIDAKWYKRRARSANSDRSEGSSSAEKQSQKYRMMMGYYRSSSTPPVFDTIEEGE